MKGCGGNHTIMIGGNGKVYSMGYGEYGQLGVDKKLLDNNNILSTPTLIYKFILENVFITSVSCGKFHSIFLSKSGEIFSCGLFFFFFSKN